MRFLGASLRSRRLLALLALLAGIVAATFLPLIAFRLIAGPSPNWHCGQSAPATAGEYLFWQEGVFLISAGALALVLLRLSTERRRAVRTYGTASFSTATFVALMAVAALTAVFLALHAAFAIYGTLLVFVGIGIMQLGFLGGLVAVALVSLVLIRSGEPDANMAFRSLQVLGWCALAVGLPVAFIFTAPLGPLLC
jgi:hypothetical protein